MESQYGRDAGPAQDTGEDPLLRSLGMAIEYTWRCRFTSTEATALQAAAFEHRRYADKEWDWLGLYERHSLGWVTARNGSALVGFVNVLSDGLVHAWIQDVMTAAPSRRAGIGSKMVGMARDQARAVGCECLHADFDDDLRSFSVDACEFAPTDSGLIELAWTRRFRSIEPP